MDTSKFLSKILGMYLLIISAAMLVNIDQFMLYVKNLTLDTSLMFVLGFFTLILGLIMVVSHNTWEWSWRLVITLIAWMILLRGVSMVFYPQLLDSTTALFVQNKDIAYSVAGFDFLFGLLLIYFGFKRQ